MSRRDRIANQIRKAAEEGPEINPATGNPIMTYDDFMNIDIALQRNGGVVPKSHGSGWYVFETPEEREAGLKEAEEFFPSLGYALKEEDGKYILQLTGE